MAETPAQVLVRLYAKLKKRGSNARKYGAYYNGEHNLKFASPEFSNIAGDLFDGFADNWTQVIVDSTLERLMPMAFRLDDGSLDSDAWDSWRRNECDVEISLALLEALISGRSYALVWRPDGPETEITFYDATSAIVEYVPGKRRVRRYGMLIWTDDAREYATLFTPDQVFRFSRPIGYAGADDYENNMGVFGSGTWVLETELPNPLKVVPLVAFENRARLQGKPVSEVANVAPLQDTVNTLWAHLLTNSDALAVPARVVTGMDRPTREITDDDGEVVGEEDLPLEPYRSNRLLWLESESAGIAEFSAADLTNYTNVIGTAVQHIAAQTRTPPHYLLGQVVNISADALAAAESGLVAKVTERQRFFGASLRELMRLDALAKGDAARADSLALGSVVWRDPQFRSDAQYADALTKLKAINVPDEALWERIPGVTPDEIERWKTMRDDQAAAIVGGNIAGLFGPKPDDAPAEQPTDNAGGAPEGV
jgi:hypothetical protein